jgi:hypothetical protein
MARKLSSVRLREIAGLLRTPAGSAASLAALRPAELRKRTRGELLEIARKLELKGVSKLAKDALAARVLAALRELAREGKAGPAPGKAPVEKPGRKGAKGAGAAGRPGRASGTPRAPRKARAPEPAPGAPQRAPDEDPTATAKLDLGPAGKAERPVAHIPWSYGQDRVVAAAVDPDRLFVYWEVTDPALEKARARLGPGGPGAWLNLRVYDTTGLIFDGTNAHAYFDQRVERSDRQWFFAIRKPTSTAYVELGMKSTEGFFASIRRSGRVDFPRKEPAAWSEPEWLTVIPATGEVRDAGAGAPSGGEVGGPPPVGGAPPPFEPIGLWRLHETGAERETRIAELLAAGWERVEWEQVEGEGGYELRGRVEWQGPMTTSTWEAGPFTYPVEVEPPSREGWRGPALAFRVGGVTHVVYGPWQVVIRNLGARQSRAVLGRWVMFRSWVAGGGRELRVATRPGAEGRVGASERLGASERVWLAGSELRLGGASELWRLGASELRLGGASELLFAGASRWVMAGASERRLAGASESRLGGASESRLGGASEQVGGSERRLGASEERLGASEQRPRYPKVEE